MLRANIWTDGRDVANSRFSQQPCELAINQLMANFKGKCECFGNTILPSLSDCIWSRIEKDWGWSRISLHWVCVASFRHGCTSPRAPWQARGCVLHSTPQFTARCVAQLFPRFALRSVAATLFCRSRHV